MNKYRWISFLCIFCLLMSGCASRKAPAQLKKSPYLRADGTSIVNAEGEQVKLASKRVSVSPKQNGKKEMKEILAQQDVNSLTVQLSADLVDCGEEWSLSAGAKECLQQAAENCRAAEKYLLVEFAEYPEQHLMWQDEERFLQNVAALWGEIAEVVGDEVYFGAYVISNISRPSAPDEADALSLYEQMLASIIAAIRARDELHMISVEMMTPYMKVDKYHAFPMVKDKNFTYVASVENVDFYTAQSNKAADGIDHLVYPNTFWHNVEDTELEETIYGSEITTASMDYQTRATKVFQVEQEGLFARIGASVLPDENGGGELRVLSVRFVECDESGNEKRVIYNMDSSVGTKFEYQTVNGFADIGSEYDDGTAYLESITEGTFFYVSDLNIPMETGKYYQLTVTMKQRGMNSDFECTPAVELYTCGQYNLFDAQMLKSNCDVLFAEAQKVGVPLIFNEIGVGDNVTKEKGREQYLSDLLSVIDTLGQNYIAY